jgi:predicted nucleic acid-binding protein
VSARVFVDTNVLVYLFDARVAAKQRRAAELFEMLGTDAYTPVVSTQVLQEAFVALTRKLSVEAKEALAILRQLEDSGVTIQTVGVPVVWRAATRVIKDKLSFWDALIVEAALEADCGVLYSEDLQTGRVFEGLVVANPFA